MDSLLAFSAEHLQLSAGVPVHVRQMVQQAISSYDNRPLAEKLFTDALHQAPDEMEIYVAFYKFYFYQKSLPEAEKIANQALKKVAQLTGLPADWRRFNRAFASWTRPDSPVRYYLYTMKALAFIALRQENMPLALEILQKLSELDPEDRVGGSVIQQLAHSLMDDDYVH